MPVSEKIKTALRVTGISLLLLSWAALAFGDGLLRLNRDFGFHSAEFDGIWFKTRYQNRAELRTPVLLEMDYFSRALNVVFEKPERAGFKFLMQLTPREYEIFKNRINQYPADIFLFHAPAGFIAKTYPAKIKEITIIIDRFTGIDKYWSILDKKVKSCAGVVLKPDPSHPDMKRADVRCEPILFEAKVLKIERSVLSPSLPPEYEFPELDYLDIRVEILKVK